MQEITPRPVRRRLVFGENIDDQAKVDNFANVLKESIVKDREEKSKKWNFDFENEQPLEGRYEWSRKDGNSWTPMIHKKREETPRDDERFKSIQYRNENTPAHVRDPPNLNSRKRRHSNIERKCSESVRRKVAFD